MKYLEMEKMKRYFSFYIKKLDNWFPKVKVKDQIWAKL